VRAATRSRRGVGRPTSVNKRIESWGSNRILQLDRRARANPAKQRPPAEMCVVVLESLQEVVVKSLQEAGNGGRRFSKGVRAIKELEY
jgi:hypothetical protein